MKKFLTLCLAAMMALTSAATVLADDDVMLISAAPETGVADVLVIDDVNAPKTAALYATAFRGGRAARYIPRQVTITVDAGENGTVDVPAKFFAACTSSRTFNITANEGYEVADILVNGVSFGAANSVKLKNIQVAMDIEVVYAPKVVYTAVYTENFDGESTIWVNGGTTDSAVLADGKLTVTSTGGDPNINYPEAFGLNCDDIDVIRVKYTNNTDNTAFQIFFTNEANPGYSEAGSFKATCVAGENEIVIETAGNELWTGILSNMRIDLSNGEGSFIVDSISFETVSLAK